MPRLTQATAAKRRMHILQATMRCLFEKGLTAMSVDDVCTTAGISKGAFYSHFPSKEALLYAVTELLSSELGPLESDSIEALAASIFERRVAPALPPPNARFGIEMVAASVSDAGLRDFNIANLENLRSHVEQAVRDLAAAGKAHPHIDPAEIGRIVQAYVLGILCRNAIWRGVGEDEIRASILQLIGAFLAPRG